MHSWYQMILGSNEALYYWMDEGFTSYASSRIMASMFEPNPEGIHAGSYSGYYYIAKSGVEEPLTTHADHFKTNTAYGIAAYSKGAVFLNQLEYIVGKPIFDKALLAYFEAWKFKHPNSNDVIRIFEKESGLELDWYREYFVFTTKQIDYGVKSVEQNKKKSKTDITLERVGDMPMPMDIIVEYTDGSKESYYVPMVIMRGNKVAENSMIRKDLADWAWTNTTYTFTIDHELDDVKSVTIDPSKRIADVNDANNIWESEGS
jgi:aminopeptidase N